jgi:hypothetical protein
MKAQNALEVLLHIFLTSPLDEGERSVPRPQPLYPWGQIPQLAFRSSHWTGDWLGPVAGIRFPKKGLLPSRIER